MCLSSPNPLFRFPICFQMTEALFDELGGLGHDLQGLGDDGVGPPVSPDAFLDAPEGRSDFPLELPPDLVLGFLELGLLEGDLGRPEIGS